MIDSKTDRQEHIDMETYQQNYALPENAGGKWSKQKLVDPETDWQGVEYFYPNPITILILQTQKRSVSLVHTLLTT